MLRREWVNSRYAHQALEEVEEVESLIIERVNTLNSCYCIDFLKDLFRDSSGLFSLLFLLLLFLVTSSLRASAALFLAASFVLLTRLFLFLLRNDNDGTVLKQCQHLVLLHLEVRGVPINRILAENSLE